MRKNLLSRGCWGVVCYCLGFDNNSKKGDGNPAKAGFDGLCEVGRMIRKLRTAGVCLFGLSVINVAVAGVLPIDDSQVLGSGAVSYSEKWTGLFANGTPENPRNLGSLEDGMIPNSNNAGTLLTKVSGGGYLAGSSIYWQSGIGGVHGPGGTTDMGVVMPVMLDIMNGTVTQQDAADYVAQGYGLTGNGVFQIASSSLPATSLDSIVFQIQIGGFGPLEADFESGTYVSSYYLTNLFSPVTLTINGTTSIELKDFWNVYYGFLDVGSEAQGTYSVDEVWAFQWDLSGYGPIESYEIEFANYPHSSIRGLQVDLVTSAVPEPSVVTLMFIGAGAVAWMAMRRRAARLQA